MTDSATTMAGARDLRETRLYRQVKAFYEQITAEGRDEITDAADVTLSPDGRFAALTGTVHLARGTDDKGLPGAH